VDTLTAERLWGPCRLAQAFAGEKQHLPLAATDPRCILRARG
jgi:hypothetical protein